METYGKIITAWTRDPATKHRTLIEDQWATDELAALADLSWEWTEKIDGTNIRVHWADDLVSYGGRTEKAQIPPFLLEYLEQHLDADAFRLTDLPPMTIYGEGYGAKIQKGGGDYIPDGVGLIAFDVLCGDLWLGRDDVADVAEKLGTPIVPQIGSGTLARAIGTAREGFPSVLAEGRCAAEGLVMRPPCGLIDRRGDRIIAKIKAKDFGVTKT